MTVLSKKNYLTINYIKLKRMDNLDQLHSSSSESRQPSQERQCALLRRKNNFTTEEQKILIPEDDDFAKQEDGYSPKKFRTSNEEGNHKQSSFSSCSFGYKKSNTGSLELKNLNVQPRGSELDNILLQGRCPTCCQNINNDEAILQLNQFLKKK